MLAIVVMVLATGGMVLVHAIGRYAFARAVGLPIERVEPRIGGFVHLAAGPDRGWARLGTQVAGTVATYLGVAALAFGFFTCHGVPTGVHTTVVREVLEGYDAVGKLAPGDRIVAVDGTPLYPGRGPSLAQLVAAKQGAPVVLAVRRAGEALDVTVRPRLGKEGAPPWLIGLRLQSVPEVATGTVVVAAAAGRYPIEQVRVIVAGFIAELAGPDDPDPGGPVRIVEEFRRSSELDGFAGQLALLVAVYAMLVLALLDAIGAVRLGFGRARRRPAA